MGQVFRISAINKPKQLTYYYYFIGLGIVNIIQINYIILIYVLFKNYMSKGFASINSLSLSLSSRVSDVLNIWLVIIFTLSLSVVINFLRKILASNFSTKFL